MDLAWGSTDEFLKFGNECKGTAAKKLDSLKCSVILSGVFCREGPMYPVDSADAAGESIDPSARKERGLQDDKSGKKRVSEGTVWRLV